MCGTLYVRDVECSAMNIQRAVSDVVELRLVVERKPLPAGALPASMESAAIAANLHPRVAAEPVEVFGAVYGRLGRPVAFTMPYKGNRCAVAPELSHLVVMGLQTQADNMVVFHNHPDAREVFPSPGDLGWTRALLQYCHSLPLRIADHLIFGPEAGAWYSMRENGELGDLHAEASTAVATLADTVARAKGRHRRRPATVKYRHPDDSSKTWSGRGSPARWITEEEERGRGREEFRVPGT